MRNIVAIRWIAIGLHAIVLSFAVIVVGAVVNWDFAQIGTVLNADSNAKEVMWRSALLLGGNALGIALLLTPLFGSFSGSCLLVTFEILFLIASFLWLAFDYSIVIAIIAAALTYVAVMRRQQGNSLEVISPKEK